MKMNLNKGRPGVLMLMSLNADSSCADSSKDCACLSADSSLMLIQVETVLIRLRCRFLKEEKSV